MHDFVDRERFEMWKLWTDQGVRWSVVPSLDRLEYNVSGLPSLYTWHLVAWNLTPHQNTVREAMIQVLLSTLQQRKKVDEFLRGVKCWIFFYRCVSLLAFKLTNVGHLLMVSTNTNYIQWFSLAKPTSKVTPIGRNRSLVACTSKCGWVVWYMNNNFLISGKSHKLQVV